MAPVPNVQTSENVGYSMPAMSNGCGTSLWKPLFHPLFTPIDYLFSPQVNISAGRGIYAAVYNLAEGEEIYTNLVSMMSGCVIDTGPCCTPAGVTQRQGTLIDRERVTLGDGNWWIFKNNPQGLVRKQMMINIPGRYQFELQNQEMSSTIYMEYMDFDCKEVRAPWPYLGGIKQ